ncbi:hypothetical protein PAF15_05650 [Weissella koreensis]|uniref:Uncharacterized protein n=1 Tax=Weissella koreensis TaxID=165096 RepID=A0A7H1MN79_9LACO|nr:EbsA family protein [Weissella koreensis]AEJ24101.1 pore-forming protein [Weissella koreensis KACC 15510]AVH75713.1 hypothetical protein C4597_06790 [Weissella koreensis]EJF34702.1 hypothetical protein JC2156_15430 [Weissella koreensis KCTC 3621]MCZ9311427.1 hypothetical protein [Weissella koreensis]QGN20934.1 hypothetical protein GKC51_06770 [Weissella koreensis]
MRSYYQTGGLSGLVIWAWVLMIGLLALTLQLEFITFNVWTYLVASIFVVAVVFMVLRHKVELTDDYIHLKQILSFNRLSIRLDGIKHVQMTKHGIIFDYNDNSYDLLLTKKMRSAIEQKIGAKK